MLRVLLRGKEKRDGASKAACWPMPRGGAIAPCGFLSGMVMVLLLGALAHGQEGATPPHWIWYPTGKPLHELPAETRYFRKAFLVKETSRLVLDVTADDSFALYLDGKPVATGKDWRTTQSVATVLAVGRHVLAAVASNESPGPAGFLLRGGVYPLGQNVPVHTDSSWRTTGAVPKGDDWTKVGFDDSDWARPADFGPLGSGPWGDALGNADAAGRFRLPGGFQIAEVAGPAVTGSVVAFTFDPDGAPCVSIERGPIARLVDSHKDGRYDRRQVVETSVRNCQGLSFIRGFLFAVGDGPKGAGLYRLADGDKDGVYEGCELVRGARGGMGEHGPHAVALGPDGLLYVSNGNHAHYKPPIDPHSPVNVAYEGELLPHYNDPTGHAAGVMAPGGEILRSEDLGRTWKRIAAGFRNEYDFAFNAEGELFTFDADMEYDVALPWYRPVRVNHCPIGAEFGWRNGSGKWPPYFFDSLPATLDVGRGSPTGVTFYQARQFPALYHDSLLVCDWSQGRILAVRLKRAGASYSATWSELVSGQPLNCTDIEVGPDKAVYFTTGGRGTQGGLYRVSWSEARPEPKVPRPTARDALAFASPLASFTQNRVEQIRRANPQEWSRTLESVARNKSGGEAAAVRIRALELLSQFGPRPSDELLCALASDRDVVVRGRAVGLLGLRSTAAARDVLLRALSDPDPFVRRHACEGWMQQPRETIPVDALLPLLASSERWLRFAARVAIEHGDLEKHREQIMNISQPRPLVEGMLALVRALPLDAARQEELLLREASLLESHRAGEWAGDLLRLTELTYMLGPRKADAPASARLRPILLRLFSTSVDSPLERETARLLAYLDEPRAVRAILEHQSRVAAHATQIHDAYCLRAMKRGWTAEYKERFWAWSQSTSNWEGGYSVSGYLERMLRELVALLTPAEKERYLALGEQFPFPTRVLVRAMDLGSEPGSVAALESLYGRLGSGKQGRMESELRAVIIEKLGSSSRPDARAALRALYGRDPEHRDQIARVIARHPREEDRDLLASALSSRGARTAAAQNSRQNEHTLHSLVQNVLAANVMKTASPERGQTVLERAKCLDCHKFGPRGQGVGPDLSTLNSRFRPGEILESIVEPSKVISDQYKSVAVATLDGKVYNGMPVASDGENLVLLLSDSTRVTIKKADIDSQKESALSVMPQGLLNTLNYQEIADLLALFESVPRPDTLGKTR